MTDTAIELDMVGKRYRGNWGLRGCTLRIPAGRVVGLVGPNGAGKSTLLNLMVGLLEPTEGTIRLLGGQARDREVLSRVAFIDQEHSMYRTFTVSETLKVGQKLNSRWDQRVAETRLAELGIPLDRRLSKLSGGQRAQVALAAALARRPELLLLDEPVAALDPLARKNFMGVLLEDVAERGTTVMISSHVVAELERFCDYLVVIGNGRVQITGDVDELLAEHRQLIGPARVADAVAADQVVVHRADDSGQSSLLVRSNHPVSVPEWQARKVNLEEMVLGYLSASAEDPVKVRRELVERTVA